MAHRPLVALFFLFFLLGSLFPDYWWSVHFLSFLSPPLKYGLLLLTAFLILFSGKLNFSFQSTTQRLTKTFHNPLWVWVTAAIMGVLFYRFPMVEDFYGEAYLLNERLLDYAKVIPDGTREALFSFGLSPWDGQKTIFAIVTYLTHFAGVTYREAFILFDTFFGVLFVLTWLFFLRHYLSNNTWKVLLAITALSAPFMLNFFGHIEINAPVLFANLLWITLALRYLESKKTASLWVLLVLLFVCLKLHAVALLFAPIWCLLAFHHYFKKNSFLSWGQVARYMLLPIYGIGAGAYFFVFEDHYDSRDLTEKVTEYEHLFLPLYSPEPPLDKYNMLSFNHIFDYFSEMLLWSPVAVLLLMIMVLFYRKEINWSSPEVIVSGLALLLFGSLFFVTNPLLTMQMDWDLFSMPAPLMLVFCAVLVKQIQNTDLATKVSTSVVAFALLCLPIFLVHQSREMLSHRLESVGIRIYHTYYEWSALAIHNGLGLMWKDRGSQLKRKENILQKLKPHAKPVIDREYAGMWSWEARHFLKVEKRFEKALDYLKVAEEYYPMDKNALMYNMETHFMLGQPELAYQYSLMLIYIGYPNHKHAQMAAIQCALEAEFYDKALLHSKECLEKYGDDEFIQTIHDRLINQDHPETLKELFTSVK